MDVHEGYILELKNPTYKWIQEYAMEKYGIMYNLKYIAEVKWMFGIEMGKIIISLRKKNHYKILVFLRKRQNVKGFVEF